jgi:biopolymer transport protein ExbD
MRKSPINQAAESSNDIDLTPMLDVVFIMLIFFIVTASFIREAGIDINRPDTNTAEKQKSVSILIAVSASNEIWVDRRRIDVRSVRANVERLRAENPKGAVIVQADNESNTKTVARVIDGAREAGAVNVILSTLDSSKL